MVIVAHGQKFTGDVYLGLDTDTLENHTVSRTEIEASLASPNGVDITIISTACFSGLWILPPMWETWRDPTNLWFPQGFSQHFIIAFENHRLAKPPISDLTWAEYVVRTIFFL